MIKIENAPTTIGSSDGRADHRRILLIGQGVRIWIEELPDSILKDVNMGDKYAVTITKA